MYEITPDPPRKKERFLLLALLIIAVAVYSLSLFGIPFVPPFTFQLVSVILLAADVLLLVNTLMCVYTYRVEPTEDGDAEFTITERKGRRETVVCRVLLSNVSMVVPVTSENRADLKKARKSRKCYNYTGMAFPENTAWLDASESGVDFSVLIFADSGLMEALRLS